MRKNSTRVAAARRARAREDLIARHLYLVKSIAMYYKQTLPVHVELDDLLNAGIVGLVQAANKFKADRKVSFSTYAKHRVKGEILDHLRRLDCLGRHTRREVKKIEAVIDDLSRELQRPPLEEEIAQRLGMCAEALREKRLLLNIRLVAHKVGEISVSSIANRPGRRDLQPDFLFEHTAMSEFLDKAMNACLSTRHRQVILLYYSGMTMKQVGRKLGVNQSRISQMHKRALEKMNAFCKEQGITAARDLLCAA